MSESFATKNWPGQSALGKRIRFGSDLPPHLNEPWHTIVGVVAENKHGQLKGDGRGTVYLPYSSDHTPYSVLLRTAGDPLRLVKSIQARIATIDRDIAVSHIFSLEQLVERASWQDRFFTVLFSAFAVLALALAGVGLYAVLSYTVSLRHHEIGIRMALGAPASSIRQMVMRNGLALAAGGLLIGIMASLAFSRLLAKQLYETSPVSPSAYIVAAIALLCTAAAASYLPGRRATRVDPVAAMRVE